MASTATVVNSSGSQNANTVEAVIAAITVAIPTPANGEQAVARISNGWVRYTFVTGAGWMQV
jgi:hypothetical protein